MQKMIKVSPEYQLILNCFPYGIELFFYRVPEKETAEEIYSIESNAGIRVEPITENPILCREYYLLSISPVYDVLAVADSIVKALTKAPFSLVSIGQIDNVSDIFEEVEDDDDDRGGAKKTNKPILKAH